MLMFTFYVFMQELTAYIWYSRAVNNSPTLSLCSSSSKVARTKVEHEFQIYEASIYKRYSNSYLVLVNSEVSIIPSWVIEVWNGLESNRFNSLYQVSWDFLISFQNKPCFAPHLILSDRSMCICPYQGI